MKSTVFRAIWITLCLVGVSAFPATLVASPVTLEGTVSYNGAYSADTLYVAAIDTAGGEDVNLLDLVGYAVGNSPLAQPYSVTFENTGVSPMVFIAAFLDVDGGGVNDISGADVFGWYGEQPEPTPVSSLASQGNLDFSLPRAEIHGTITLAAGQDEARIDISQDVTCGVEGLRPGTYVFASGDYEIVGLYAGSYCLSARGNVMGIPVRVCYGDPSCSVPVEVTLTATQVRTGLDLDFTPTAVEQVSWQNLKSLYR
jgi:hypothetical protein